MSNIKSSLIELIGNTPMVELTNFNKHFNLKSKIIAKLESFNPLGSAKDRVGCAMIESAIKEGKVNKDTLIVEPTSGNTGIGLAYVCAIKGLKIVLTMPDTMSKERINLLKALGAEVVLTDGSLGMNGAIAKAKELASDNGFIPQQFENPENPKIHYNTTALEILRDTDKNIDAFVAGIGTGGTITGVGKRLKEEIKGIKIVGIEPIESAVISGEKPGKHPLQGIGAGFIPKILDVDLLDEVLKI
ncbi:MAG: pyridoxal-phosphate dependent enzyme, partial [Oscillospiraceae bacterium]